MPEPTVRLLDRTPAPDDSVCRATDPVAIVIFGATGDLTARKLMPALFNLHRRGLLPERSAILAVARRPFTQEAFRAMMLEAVRAHSHIPPSPDEWERFAVRLAYYALVFDDASAYAGLAAALGEGGEARVFYLATDPAFFMPIIENLGRAGLLPAGDPAVRVVIEKPFGRDLASALDLSRGVAALLAEDQVYRIDHYLGKETVLNILSFRFGNAIFETLFNSRYVDHVQITVAETVGMEGRRGQYYDTSGALRDVVQNHALQLLGLVAMEPPAVFAPKEIRDEKVKVLRSLRPLRASQVGREVVRGQYVAGAVEDRPAPAYRAEQGVDPRSNTETYVAMRLLIDNWRWAGVPFFLRTGKRLARRTTEIAVQFKQPPLHLFTTVECVGDVCDISQAKPNVLVFRIQPDEGISLLFSAKRPGMLFQLHPVQMDFFYNQAFSAALPEAYERLLLDAVRGDSTLFTRSDEVQAAWEFLDPILKAWSGPKPPPLHFYEAGTWGPPAADDLLEASGATWRNR